MAITNIPAFVSPGRPATLDDVLDHFAHVARLVGIEHVGLGSDADVDALDDLLEIACRPPRVYRYRWQPGDIAIWDNRCLLHRACAYDYRQARVMKHTRISGDASEVAPSSEGC